MRVVEINNALPAVVLDGIDNRLMIIRTHADSEIQQARRRGEHLEVCKRHPWTGGCNNVMCTLHEAIIKWNAFPLGALAPASDIYYICTPPLEGPKGETAGCKATPTSRYIQRDTHRYQFPFSSTYTGTERKWGNKSFKIVFCIYLELFNGK